MLHMSGGSQVLLVHSVSKVLTLVPGLVTKQNRTRFCDYKCATCCVSCFISINSLNNQRTSWRHCNLPSLNVRKQTRRKFKKAGQRCTCRECHRRKYQTQTPWHATEQSLGQPCIPCFPVSKMLSGFLIFCVVLG